MVNGRPQIPKPLTVRRLLFIIVVVVVAMMVLAVVIVLIMIAVVFFGFSSYSKSCTERAESMVSRNGETIASFKSIRFAGDTNPVKIEQPSVSRGDCVDSRPELSLVKTYDLNEPVDVAATSFESAVTDAGYRPRYEDYLLECDTADRDGSLTSYENIANRQALDKARADGTYDVPTILIKPRLTCDDLGQIATQLEVTLSISD